MQQLISSKERSKNWRKDKTTAKASAVHSKNFAVHFLYKFKFPPVRGLFLSLLSFSTIGINNHYSCG